MITAALNPKPLRRALIAFLSCVVLVYSTAVDARAHSDEAVDAQKLLDSDQFQQAKELLETAIRSGKSSPENWLMLGAAYSALGLRSQAMKAFQTVVESRPDVSSALYNLGVLSLQDGHYAEASGYLGRFIGLKPNDVEGRLRNAASR